MNCNQDELIEKYKSGTSILKLSQIYGIKYDKIRNLLIREGVEIRGNGHYARKYCHDTHYFDSIDTEEKAYWLGFLLADGFITERNVIGLSLNEVDKQHLEKFKCCLQCEEPIHTYTVVSGYKPGTTYSRILLYDNHMSNVLQKLCVVKNKSLVAQMPSIIPELRRHLIRGFFDGNGSLVQSSGKYTVKFCGTFEILEYIKKELQLSDKLKILHDKRLNDSTNNYNLDIGGKIQSKRAADYIYKKANIFLDRKYKKYLRMEETYSHNSRPSQ